MSDRPAPISNTIASPCVRNCCLDEDDVCMGCFRSVDEIIRWGNACNDERQAILHNASQRKHTRITGNTAST